jgi:G8 domain
MWLASALLLTAAPHDVAAASRPHAANPQRSFDARRQPRTSLSIPSEGLPAACQSPAGATSLAKCMDNMNNVVIGAGATNADCKTNVVVDQAVYTLGKVTIGTGGVLVLPEQTAQLPVSIKTTGIEIDGGTLQIGHPDCPIGNINPMTRVTINFTGRRPASCPPGGMAPCAGDVKGIQVENHGTLKMYGATGAPPQGVSWTTLSDAAGPEDGRYDAASGAGTPVPTGGSTTLQLTDDVTQGTGPLHIGAWRDGDWIAVATTSFSPFETEFVQIDKVTQTAGGSQVTLKQPLQYYHFGGPAPTPSQLCTDTDGNTKRLACGATDRRPAPSTTRMTPPGTTASTSAQKSG